jgi:hypothetical protein
LFDHHLVARAQACATGANAHELHSLLASYYGFSELVPSMPECAWRLEAIEQRLRIFCQTGKVPRSSPLEADLVAC